MSFLKTAPGILLLIFGLAGCQPGMVVPEKFAPYRKSSAVKAISADGVRLKVKTIANDPWGDIALWTGTVEMHLKEQGYKTIKSEDISSARNGKGRYILSLYSFQNRDYAYMITLFVQKSALFDRIVVVEAAGPFNAYEKHEAAIQKAITTIDL
jgi:hypothetical protein